MMGGYSIRKAAEKCGINKSTAFEWRHKILDALQNMDESVKLDGIVEGDENFFYISYKGNHNNSKFVMPRESHHRGKQTHIRGLSHEKVCVPCAINRNGLSIAKVSNLGRVSSQNLHNVFDNRIKGVSTKYLNNYLIWNNILNYSKETWPEKKNIFMSY
ncbi:MAG: IS1595 family transposase, partial [Alphaproteobacteria bacterium]|nr:IS1595 family transposase [Alphaproteobacteria bacterium]